MSTYDAMTMDELQAEFVSLASQLAVIQDARQKIMRLMDARKLAATAKFSLNGASELEKDTLRALLDKPGSLNADAVSAVAKP